MHFSNVAVCSNEQTRAAVCGRLIIIQITAGRKDICQAVPIFEHNTVTVRRG